MITMWITNPDEKRFVQFITSHLSEKYGKEEPGLIEALSYPLIEEVGTKMIEEYSMRTNYGICSLYEISTPGDRWLYIGVFNQFIPLQKNQLFNFTESQEP